MARISRHVTVVRDGYHNGFTDLQYWQGMYWVGYRRGSGHATMDGEAIVSVSTDRTRFREAATIKVYGDNRDPKLFPIDEDRMACIIPTWEGAYTSETLRSTIAFSNDGFNWDTPRYVLGAGEWLWRIRPHDGRYYGLVEVLTPAADGGREHGLAVMTSENLLDWESLATVGGLDIGLCESDIVFRDDGEAWIVARSTKGEGHSYFCTSRPPYEQWECKRLDALIHAPIMLEHEGRLYVAGRSRPVLEGDGTFPSSSSLAIWEVKSYNVTPVLRIPAMGDCSYPGWIKDPEGRICMTYYSQHAYYMGVVPADIPFENSNCMPNDVYFMELELP